MAKAYQLLPRDKFYTRMHGLVKVVRVHEDAAAGTVTAIVSDREGAQHTIPFALGADVELE